MPLFLARKSPPEFEDDAAIIVQVRPIDYAKLLWRFSHSGSDIQVNAVLPLVREPNADGLKISRTEGHTLMLFGQ